MDIAINAGFTAIREPNSHIRPARIADQDPLSASYNEHADLLLLKHDLKLYIDVVITRPTKQSALKHAGTLFTPLFTTRNAESGKRAKYNAIAQANGYTLIPFAMESYGGFGKEAKQLLLQLSRHSREYSAKAFLAHARQRLSCTLHSSNANIALQALQEYHLHSHSRCPAAYAHHQRARAASFGYPQPIDSDQLARRMAPLLSSLADHPSAEAEAADDESHQSSFTHATRAEHAGLTIRLDSHDVGRTADDSEGGAQRRSVHFAA